MSNLIIVNLFGVPSAGKSTGAAYVFSQLKMRGVNAELITEFAKEKAWENNTEALRNQAYVFGEQYYRISRCEGKVDVLVTDSPLPLSIVYNQDHRLGKNFNSMVMDVFNSFQNLNYCIRRVKPFNPVGRFQTESESNALSAPITNLLLENKIPFTNRDGDEHGYMAIVQDVVAAINQQHDFLSTEVTKNECV